MEATQMETLPLSLKVLLGFLHQAITGIEEPRKASNATRYSIKDPILGAFSVFFMQCESFLEHQRQKNSRQGKNNPINDFIFSGVSRLYPLCSKLCNHVVTR
jgi:hypothetical protein